MLLSPPKISSPTKFYPLVGILLAFWMLACARPASAQSRGAINTTTPAKQILLLNSYGYGRPGPAKFNRAFIAALTAAGMSIENVFVEYLDLERDKDTPSEHSGYLIKKYADRNIDLIVTLQQPALEFFLKELSSFKPDVPLIAAVAPLGVNITPGRRKIVYQESSLDFAGTLASALAIFPDTQRVLLITGSSDVDISLIAAAKKALAPWGHQLQFDYTNELTLEQVLQRVTKLPQKTIIMAWLYDRDKSGRTFVPVEVAQKITGVASAPLFFLYDIGVETNEDIVGGSVFDIKASGTQVAQKGLEILGGVSPKAPLTPITARFIPMFNWPKIDYWHGQTNKLPPESILLHRPLTLWGQYKGYVIATGLAFGILWSFISILLIERRLRRKIEASLRQSEDQFRTLIEHAPEAIMVFDIDRHQMVTVNAVAAKLFGCSREVLLRADFQRFSAILCGHDASLQGDIIGHCSRLDLEDSRMFESDIVDDTGKKMVCEVRLVRLPSMSHRLIRASLIEITERKRVEQAIKESENLLQNVLQILPVGVWISDKNGTVTHANSAGRRIWEGTRDVAIEQFHLVRAWWSTTRELIKPEEWALARAIAHGETSIDEEIEIECFDHTHKQILNSAVPIKNELEEIIGAVAVSFDITERKRVQEELKKSEQLYRAIGESIDFGVWVCTPEGRNIYTSDSFLKLVGLTQQQYSDFGLQDRLHSEDAQRTKDDWSTSLAEGSALDVEFRCRGVDGGWHPILMRGIPVRDEHGLVTCWAGINLDISRLKQSEEKLTKAKAEAEMANQVKGQFLANMSHELRTPMNAIIGMTDLTLMTELTEKQRKYLEYVKSGSRTLLSVINDILDFTKIESGHMHACYTRFDLIELIKEKADLYQNLVKAKPLSFSCTIHDDVPSWLFGDPFQLNQILNNLLNNAIKFTASGEIQLNVARLAQTENRATVQFMVKDTGIGIATENIERLFTYFSQLDASFTRKYGGSGLGLAISKALVTQMDGEMLVQSELGKGSTFSFSIPFALDVV